MGANYDEFDIVAKTSQLLARHKGLVSKIAHHIAPAAQPILDKEEIKNAIDLKILDIVDGQIIPGDELITEFLSGIRLIDSIDGGPTKVVEFLSKNHNTSIGTTVMANNFFDVNLFGSLRLAGGHDFWTLFHNVCRALKYFTVSPKELVDTLQSIRKKIERDMMAGELSEVLVELGYNQAKLAADAIDMVIDLGETDALPFVPSLYEGFAKRVGTNSAYEKISPLINSSNVELERSGIFCLSIAQKNPVSDEVPKILDAKLAKGDVRLYAALAQSWGNLLSILPDAKDRLLQIGKTDDRQTLYVLSEILWRKKADYTEEWYLAMLNELAKVKPEDKGTLRTIGYSLTDRVKSSPDLVFEFIGKWLAHEHNKPDDIRVFDYLFDRIYSENRDLFSRLVTLWLVNENLKFQLFLVEILNRFFVNGVKFIELDAETLYKFDPDLLKVAVLRTLGFVYHKEHLETILFSVLKHCKESEPARDLIVSAFTQYVVYNYPSVIDFLKKKEAEATEFEKVAIQRMVNHWNSYVKELKKLGQSKELGGSDERVAEFWKLQSKIFSKGLVKRDESSIFNMVKTIDVKSGGAMFMKTKEGYSEKSRLGVITAGGEMPRGEYIDPIGQAKLRFLWKTFEH